ncbi:MAG TPA: N-acetyl-gamma-glutamyl-phosphate reductase, partial [Actinobacteria bacterium]|nr:N-acetyl-gamma-glutamyl-phosphate reductase [Actinomycetota bacterium]
ASPGCYPTAALLGLDPLLRRGLVEPTQIVVDALSGVSGAGRKTSDSLMYSVIDESVAAYAIASHRHRPEIEMALESSSGIGPIVSFTPHLVPMQRGLLSTCSAPLTDGTGLDDLRQAMSDAYAREPFVEVSDRPPHTRWVVGSNKAIVHVAVDEHAGRAIAVVAIDNLIKGAAGQAVQAANLMFDIDEAAGLSTTGGMP